jgi:very-short-patch-repair endonuclease
VIELDGDPHVIDDKIKARDKFVDDVLTKVGIKILRIPRFDNHYNIEALNKKISDTLIPG